MLHDVSHIHQVAIDADLLERLVEHPARRSHEGPALDVLAVAGLLADHHHLGLLEALAEHRLGAGLPQVTCAAIGGSTAQLLERLGRRPGAVELDLARM